MVMVQILNWLLNKNKNFYSNKVIYYLRVVGACAERILQLDGEAGSFGSSVFALLMSEHALLYTKEPILNTRCLIAFIGLYLLYSVNTLWHILIKGVFIIFTILTWNWWCFSSHVHDRLPSGTSAGFHAAWPWLSILGFSSYIAQLSFLLLALTPGEIFALNIWD